MYPPQAWDAFRAHRNNARRRGIPFQLTFAQWWDWWQTNDRWARRGRKRDDLCMCRYGDRGPYRLSNVYCGTQAQNGQHVTRERRSAAARKSWANGRVSPLKGKRIGHPSARPVITPLGRFASAALAAEAHGYTRQHAARLARLNLKGWAYLP